MHGGIFFAIMLVGAVSAKAITFNLNHEFSGATPPSGTPPWVTITITDNGAGIASLTIANSGLVGTEFNSITLVNIADAYRGTLTIVQSGSVGSFGSATISQQTGAQDSSANPFKADGDGFFDVAFAFKTDSGSTFGAGESVTYTITSSVLGLSALSFDLTSYTGGGNGVWHAAAHVQGISPSGSGWIGDKPTGDVVPDGGSTIALLGLALVGADYLRRRMINA
jgi:hypothetical protein